MHTEHVLLLILIKKIDSSYIRLFMPCDIELYRQAQMVLLSNQLTICIYKLKQI